MKIWVDADGCPVVIKEILFRAANRTGVELILVANHHMAIPKRHNIRLVQVGAGFDVADNEIVKLSEADDLVITSDIPLAAEIIEKSAIALSFHGELFTTDNIKARLSMRNFMETLRNSGVDTGGQSAFSHSDRQKFGNQLDKILVKFNSENNQ